ncbi:MAG: hypothetical protein L0241_16790 [Planctomycetia bacterium]|nr:hypothetical protein [Planctomycetia bacterium]
MADGFQVFVGDTFSALGSAFKCIEESFPHLASDLRSWFPIRPPTEAHFELPLSGKLFRPDESLRPTYRVFVNPLDFHVSQLRRKAATILRIANLTPSVGVWFCKMMVWGWPMLLFEDHNSPTTAVDHKAVVYTLAFSPDGSTLVTGSKDGAVFLRDSSGVIPLLERGPNSPPIHAIGYLPTEPTIIIGGAFGWLGCKQEDGVWGKFGPQSFPPVNSLAVINDHLLAIGTGERIKPTAGDLEIWDISDNRKLRPSLHEPNGVRAIAAAPTKKLVAWATGHRKVRVWDITRQTPTEFPQLNACPALALSPDGTALAVAVDYYAKLYDLEKNRERLTLKGHKGQVSAVAFSPDGSTVATGSWDQTVRLWDVSSGKELANYKWDIGRVYCLSYAPDGLRLAAGGDLGRVVVWDTE